MKSEYVNQLLGVAICLILILVWCVFLSQDVNKLQIEIEYLQYENKYLKSQLEKLK